MNIRNILIVSIGLLFGLCSCDTAWDSYFEENGAGGEAASSLNLMDYLKTQDRYSAFVSLLEETQVAAELTKNQVLTVWAIPNELMSAEITSYTLDQKKQFIRNHLNNVALYKSKLDGTRKIHTLAGKLLGTSKVNNRFAIDDVLVTRMNQICQNGVVHELEGVLIPRQNIHEYLMSCGDEFSYFRDTLNAYNDTIFHPELSLPIGVDELGNTVYDSVFVIENPYFKFGDPRDEEKEFTLMLPSNDAIKRMMLSISGFFNTAGREFTAKDTNTIMTWMLKSVIHNGRITNYAGSVSRYSTFSSAWRTDKQYVQEDPVTCSNGNVFIVTSMVFPRQMYMEQLEIRPYYPLYMPEEDQDKYFWKSPGVTSAKATIMSEPHEILYASCTKAAGNWIAFSSLVKDVYGKIKEVKVMPGFYKLCISYRAFGNGNQNLYVIYEEDGKDKEEKITKFNVYLNGQGGGSKPTDKRGKYEYVPLEHAGLKNIPNDSNGLLLEKFEVKTEWGYSRLRFKLETADAVERISPQYILLIPTDDNY